MPGQQASKFIRPFTKQANLSIESIHFGQIEIGRPAGLS